MKKKIKSIWQGKVGLHQKYIKEALDKIEPIELEYVGNQSQYFMEKMTIPVEKIRELGEIGKELYPERQGIGFYRLVYFEWKPEPKNPSLFDKPKEE